jgi:nucleoside-diphosphate-sugar epimerase
MSNVLVTGGSGYAGSHLVAALLNDGHNVTTLSRGQINTTHLGNVTVLNADLADPDALARVDAPQDMDVVYHLVSAFVEAPGKSLTVTATENLLRYYAGTPLKQLIYFSNTCVYGDTRGRTASESDMPRPNTAHGHHKLQAEKLVQASGHPYTILRGSQCYGSSLPGVTSSFDWIVLGPVMRGELPLVNGGHDQRVGMVHIDDMTQIAILALNHASAIGEVFNVCSGDSTVTNRDVFHFIAETAGVPPPREIPRAVALAYGWVAAKLARLRGTEPSFIPDMVRVLYSDRVFAIDKARDALGYVPQYPDTLTGLKVAYGKVLSGGQVETISRLAEVWHQQN